MRHKMVDNQVMPPALDLSLPPAEFVNEMPQKGSYTKKVEHLGQISVEIIQMVPVEKQEQCFRLVQELLHGALE